MRQKVVIKVPLKGKKSQKALQTAVSAKGVESAAWAGKDKDQIVVTGEGIDAAELTMLLRKAVGYSELVSVGPAKDDDKKEKDDAMQIPWQYYSYYNPYGYVMRDQNSGTCSIL